MKSNKNEQLIQEFCYLHERIESWQLTAHKTREKQNDVKTLLLPISHAVDSKIFDIDFFILRI